MKKQIFIVALSLCSTISVFAQWTTSGTNVTTTGNVGIGTTTPAHKLDVKGDVYINKELKLGATVQEKGENISYLQTAGTLRLTAPLNSHSHGYINILPGSPTSSTNTYTTRLNFYDSDKSGGYQKKAMINSTGSSFFNGGNVGIGTEAPSAKLDVRGDAYINKQLRLGATVQEQGENVSYLETAGTLRLSAPKNSHTHGYINILPGSPTGSTNTYTTRLNFYDSDKSGGYQKKAMINSTGSSFFNGGNVGIGTEAPSAKLDVRGDAYINKQLRLGTTVQEQGENVSYLETAGTLRLTAPKNSHTNGYINVLPGSPSGTLQTYSTRINLYNNDKSGGYQKKAMVNSYGVSFFNGGNVGIGTDAPTAKLDVRGKIIAEEVEIKNLTKGADFVFDKDYQLKPLSEVKSFIEENKHLPEVQSEKDMQENGLNMSEFQIKLLQKIEELTLYVIKQDEEIQSLKKRLEE